jgi:peptidoglycan/LPS O-acetylase OafA/YrhL
LLLGNSAVKYRADIDGLRAIAVLSVIWFHYGASLPDWAKLPGGFIGVDVFFVISGFLITQQIYADIQVGRFSILSFYDRRIRRILPALLVMLAVVLLAGRWLLMPGDYMSLAWSTAAAALGFSNFYFLFNTGYFDQSAELMPLLHTWSLAVEEQFYFVWPALLFGLTALGSRRNLAAIICSSTAAMVCSIACLASSMRRAASLLCGTGRAVCPTKLTVRTSLIASSVRHGRRPNTRSFYGATAKRNTSRR